MKDLKRITETLCLVCQVLLFANIVSAQRIRPRNPTEPVVKQEEKPMTAPTREQMETISELISHVQVAVGTRAVTISFSTFPNTVPLVELGSVQPKLRRRWTLGISGQLRINHQAGRGRQSKWKLPR